MANLSRNRWRYILVPLFLISELVSLIYLLRKYRVDVIHAHWVIPQGIVAVLACALAVGKKPALVCTSHGTDLLGLHGSMIRWLQKQVISKSDKLTVVSEALRSYSNGLLKRDDVEVIPMGVDLTENFTPSVATKRSDHELLFVGRLVEQKGLHFLILALPKILKHHSRVTLTIIGDGTEKENLQRLASSSGVGERVAFLGAVENSALKEFYRRAVIFVSPSLSEGFGLTFVEAQGCACPVVTTDLPSLRDVVIDGVTGLVCMQKNSSDLADKICFLLDHPELREKMGKAARKHVLERFDWSAISRRYAALIENLVQEHP